MSDLLFVDVLMAQNLTVQCLGKDYLSLLKDAIKKNELEMYSSDPLAWKVQKINTGNIVIIFG